MTTTQATLPTGVLRRWDELRTFDLDIVLDRDDYNYRWLAPPTEYTLYIHAVTWDIDCEDKRLLRDVIWHGRLSWEFVQVSREISPLSTFDVIDFNLLFNRKRETSALEQLAEAKDQPTLAACLLALQQDLHFYRGCHAYRQHAVAIPAGSIYSLKLSLAGVKVPTPTSIRFRAALRGTAIHPQSQP